MYVNGIKRDRKMFQEINKHEGGNSYVDTSFIRYKRVHISLDMTWLCKYFAKFQILAARKISREIKGA